MRQRMERASRRPPPARRPAAAGAEPPAPAPEVSAAPGAPAPSAGSAPRARARRRAGEGPPPARLAADLPPANLAIRVRRPLDERLVELIHQLRRAGIRTSKVELIEMLLWELPTEHGPALTERLARFREWAPRGAGAPLER